MFPEFVLWQRLVLGLGSVIIFMSTMFIWQDLLAKAASKFSDWCPAAEKYLKIFYVIYTVELAGLIGIISAIYFTKTFVLSALAGLLISLILLVFIKNGLKKMFCISLGKLNAYSASQAMH